MFCPFSSQPLNTCYLVDTSYHHWICMISLKTVIESLAKLKKRISVPKSCTSLACAYYDPRKVKWPWHQSQSSQIISPVLQNSRTGSFVDVDSLREKTPLVQQQQRMRRGLLRPFNHHASCSFATIPSSKPGVMSFTFLHITISRCSF